MVRSNEIFGVKLIELRRSIRFHVLQIIRFSTTVGDEYDDNDEPSNLHQLKADSFVAVVVVSVS